MFRGSSDVSAGLKAIEVCEPRAMARPGCLSNLWTGSDQCVDRVPGARVKVFQESVWAGRKSRFSVASFFGLKSKADFSTETLKPWNLDSEMSG